MITKLCDSLIELLYGSFVMFIYYYLFRVFITLKPSLSVGFHPILDLETLASAFLIILGIVAVVKLVGESLASVTHRKTPAKFKYIPSQRV